MEQPKKQAIPGEEQNGIDEDTKNKMTHDSQRIITEYLQMEEPKQKQHKSRAAPFHRTMEHTHD